VTDRPYPEPDGETQPFWDGIAEGRLRLQRCASCGRYVFYPRQIMFGTDPVAIDRLLLDIIEKERRARGAISIWDRSPSSLRMDDTRARDADPNVNIIIREPGHVEYASTLGLGVYDRARIVIKDVDVP